jgi:Fe-Mn family superoxide dismutase
MITRRNFLAGATMASGAYALLHNNLRAEKNINREKPAFPDPTGLSYPYKLPDLPYAPDALEPHLDAQTMTLHHQKHHGAYVNNLNKALEQREDLQKFSLQELLLRREELAPELAKTILNNGGGHINHSILWLTMSPNPHPEPSGLFAEAIQRDFGGLENAKEALRAAAMSVFGSGWAWLCSDNNGKLSVISLPNQDPPLLSGLVALLGIDVWEHSYYLKFQNRRAEYIDSFFMTLDWEYLSMSYDTILG